MTGRAERALRSLEYHGTPSPHRIGGSATVLGRHAERDQLARAASRSAGPRIVFIHGDVGVGKSALLAEVARVAATAGRRVESVGARHGCAGLHRAIGRLRAPGLPGGGALLVDDYERMPAAGAQLRRAAFVGPAVDLVVFIASRRAPEPEWFHHGWDSALLDLRLRPLPASVAAQFLHARGVDAARATSAVRWAEGSPLMLAAAAAAMQDPAWSLADPQHRRTVESAVAQRIVADENVTAHEGALAVAAMVRVLTPELLAAALDLADAGDAYQWLQRRTFITPVVGGIAVHDTVRRLLRTRIAERDPRLEQRLRRRVADAVLDAARAGGCGLPLDLVGLVGGRAVGAVLCADPEPRVCVDRMRAGDGSRLQVALGPRLTPRIARVLSHARDRVLVARDAHDGPIGLVVCATPENAPETLRADERLGPLLAAAGADRDALVIGDILVCDHRPDRCGARIAAVLRSAAIARAGMLAPPRVLLGCAADDVDVRDGLARLGAVPVEQPAGGDQTWWAIDGGVAALAGRLHALVYEDLGVLADTAVDLTARSAAVSCALTDFRSSERLAANALAIGVTVEARAQSVRLVVTEAVDAAFGAAAGEQALKEVLLAAYIHREGSLESTAQRLHLSRSTFFRRLRIATRRLSDHIAALQDDHVNQPR